MRAQDLELKPTVAILGAVAATATVGGWLSAPGREWYRHLEKPSWQPPGWVFAPAWTILYGLAATSAIAAWHGTPVPRRPCLFALYTANAVLNAAWTGIFFRAREPGLATADSAALLTTTVALIHRARRDSSFAALTLMPYAAWVAFATALSAEITRRNRHHLGQ